MNLKMHLNARFLTFSLIAIFNQLAGALSNNGSGSDCAIVNVTETVSATEFYPIETVYSTVTSTIAASGVVTTTTTFTNVITITAVADTSTVSVTEPLTISTVVSKVTTYPNATMSSTYTFTTTTFTGTQTKTITLPSELFSYFSDFSTRRYSGAPSSLWLSLI
jgi:hypothetical protein